MVVQMGWRVAQWIRVQRVLCCVITAMRLALLLLLFPFLGKAQEHPFLGAFTLSELEGGVHVAWTIVAGGSCDGQEVQRSTDGTTFTAVHRISGICGHPTEPMQYTAFDDAPPELSTVYYRIRLGAQDYSSVKRITITQLLTSDQRVFPSPAVDRLTLLLNVPVSASVDLWVYGSNGVLVVQQKGISGDRMDLDVSGLSPGAYSYLAVAEGRRFIGRFVKR